MIAVFADSSCESRRGLCGMPGCCAEGALRGSARGITNRGRAHHAHSPPRTRGSASPSLARRGTPSRRGHGRDVPHRRVGGGGGVDRQTGAGPGGHCAAGRWLHAQRQRSEVHPQADQDRRAPRDHGKRPRAPLVGPGEFQIANPMLPYGLRTVDGSENNLQPGQNTFGAVDQKFPRLTDRSSGTPRTPTGRSALPGRRRTSRSPAPSSTRSRA